MVSINFCPSAYRLLTSGSILKFQQSMFSFPSDRHAYHLKFFMHPMRYCLLLLLHFYKIIVSRLIYFMFSQGRLPYQVKIFVKYIRLNSPPPSLLNTCKKKLSITYVLFYFFQKTIYATQWSWSPRFFQSVQKANYHFADVNSAQNFIINRAENMFKSTDYLVCQ